MNDTDTPAGQHFPPVPPLRVGLGCKCPRCGRGRLYDGILEIAGTCNDCGLDLSPHDSGDGPTVFVIFILGFLIVPLAFAFESTFAPPYWAHLALWPPLILVLAIIMLRWLKAVMVAFHFKNLHHKYDDPA